MSQPPPRTEPSLLTVIKEKLMGLPPITRFLMVSTISVPIIMKIAPNTYPLFTLLKLSNKKFNMFQPWRLVTNFFIA
ncbi:hypothetical protein HDU92_002656, partial [Lobulomyces angularis]